MLMVTIDLDFVEGLTLEERAALVSGKDFWFTAKVPGVDRMMMSDGPSGLRKQNIDASPADINDSVDAVCFSRRLSRLVPLTMICSISLGPTWELPPTLSILAFCWAPVLTLSGHHWPGGILNTFLKIRYLLAGWGSHM